MDVLRLHLAAGLLTLQVGGCGGHSARNDGNAPPMPSVSASAPAPFEGVPTFGVSEWARIEVETALAPEAIVLRSDDIELYTAEGVHRVSADGKLLGSSTLQRARGAERYLGFTGESFTAMVLGTTLRWPGPFESSTVILDSMTSATGLGLAIVRDHCSGCVYVADGPGQRITEYGDSGVAFGTLPLPDTDAQGVAVARSGRVYIADAQRRRLLRSDAALKAIDGVAVLPPGSGDVPSGLTFDDDEHLYVCFRDTSTLLVLAFDAAP